MHTDRTRDDDGELRRKRGDTLVGNLEKEYDVDFGVRSDMRLDTLRDQTGLTSIEDLLRHAAARLIGPPPIFGIAFLHVQFAPARRPDESQDAFQGRFEQEAAKADQIADSAQGSVRDPPRAEWRASKYAELQALAQEAHPTVLASDERIVFKHGNVVGKWKRAEIIDGTGPIPGYQYRWNGEAVAYFQGARAKP